MNHARKMILLDYNEAQNVGKQDSGRVLEISRVKRLAPISEESEYLADLDESMLKVLNDDTIDDYEKIRLYNELLRRFTTMKRNISTHEKKLESNSFSKLASVFSKLTPGIKSEQQSPAVKTEASAGEKLREMLNISSGTSTPGSVHSAPPALSRESASEKLRQMLNISQESLPLESVRTPSREASSSERLRQLLNISSQKLPDYEEAGPSTSGFVPKSERSTKADFSMVTTKRARPPKVKTVTQTPRVTRRSMRVLEEKNTLMAARAKKRREGELTFNDRLFVPGSSEEEELEEVKPFQTGHGILRWERLM